MNRVPRLNSDALYHALASSIVADVESDGVNSYRHAEVFAELIVNGAGTDVCVSSLDLEWCLVEAALPTSSAEVVEHVIARISDDMGADFGIDVLDVRDTLRSLVPGTGYDSIDELASYATMIRSSIRQFNGIVRDCAERQDYLRMLGAQHVERIDQAEATIVFDRGYSRVVPNTHMVDYAYAYGTQIEVIGLNESAADIRVTDWGRWSFNDMYIGVRALVIDHDPYSPNNQVLVQCIDNKLVDVYIDDPEMFLRDLLQRDTPWRFAVATARQSN